MLYFHPLITYHITSLHISCNLFLPTHLHPFSLKLRLLVHEWCCLLISYCASVDSVRRKLTKKEITDIMNEQA